MATIDLITALGRLLRDGALRDALALNPASVVAKLDVREIDRQAIMQLIPEDLEFQARALLRKRLDAIRQLVPETCRRLGQEAWPAFHRYARTQWPAGRNPAVQDAYEFSRYLKNHHAGSLCGMEWNRLQFAQSRNRLSLRWVRRQAAAKAVGPMIQVFLRSRPEVWHELLLQFRF